MMKPQDAWLATQGQLELQLSRATYDTWVKDCKFVSFENSLFTLSVRNAYIKDWLEQRLYRAIQYTLSSITRQQVEVVFVVSNPVQYYHEDTRSLPLETTISNEHVSPTAEPPQPLKRTHEGSGINANASFATFVVGASNQMAQAAAQAVSRMPGQAYNPLFVYGDVGLGKTHLLHAVGNACLEQGYKVLYTTSEQFTNHLVESIRSKTTADFREHYRRVDVLLIDDIQFIAGKESTQEEFFHTFNALHSCGKQVVLAADRRPSDIKALEKRLISRMEWGLLVDVQPPSLETRLAIIHHKSELAGHHLSNEVAQIIAQKASNNIRELEGTLTQVLAYSALMGISLTSEIAERVLLEQRGRERRRRDHGAEMRRLSLEQIMEGTAKVFQMTLHELTGKRRTKEVVQARQLAIYLARQETHASWPEIAEALGGRNHSTVLHSYNRVVDDPEMQEQVKDLHKKILEFTG